MYSYKHIKALQKNPIRPTQLTNPEPIFVFRVFIRSREFLKVVGKSRTIQSVADEKIKSLGLNASYIRNEPTYLKETQNVQEIHVKYTKIR